MRWIVAAGLLGTLAGCLGSKTVQCANGVVCPEGLVCGAPPQLCGPPPDPTACDNKGELDSCVSMGATGLCHAGTCTPCTPEQIDCPYSGWTRMHSPVNDNLFALAVMSERDVLAAGDGGTVLHYDGTEWKALMPSLDGSVQAIGGTGTSRLLLTTKPSAWRYDDGVLTEVMAPPTQIPAVWGDAANYFVAVGATGKTWVFDGATWPTATTTGMAALNAVWGRTRNDVYAAGNGGAVQHFTGAWPTTTMVPVSGVWLEGVWGTSQDEVFAVGYGTDTQVGAAIIRYAMGSWSRAMLPMEVDHATDDLRAVWGRSADDVFAVGTTGTILHLDAVNWTKMDNSGAELRAVGGTDRVVFAVGFGGTILRYTPP